MSFNPDCALTKPGVQMSDRGAVDRPTRRSSRLGRPQTPSRGGRPRNSPVRPQLGKWRYTLALPFLISLSGCIEITTYVSPAASGTVIDATSEKPIQGATISVDEQPALFAQTNSDGQFVLVPTARTTHIFVLAPYRSLPPGGTIVVVADGYASRKIVVAGGAEPLLVSLARIR